MAVAYVLMSVAAKAWRADISALLREGAAALVPHYAGTVLYSMWMAYGIVACVLAVSTAHGMSQSVSAVQVTESSAVVHLSKPY